MKNDAKWAGHQSNQLVTLAVRFSISPEKFSQIENCYLLQAITKPKYLSSGKRGSGRSVTRASILSLHPGHSLGREVGNEGILGCKQGAPVVDHIKVSCTRSSHQAWRMEGSASKYPNALIQQSWRATIQIAPPHIIKICLHWTLYSHNSSCNRYQGKGSVATLTEAPDALSSTVELCSHL